MRDALGNCIYCEIRMSNDPNAHARWCPNSETYRLREAIVEAAIEMRPYLFTDTNEACALADAIDAVKEPTDAG